MRKFISYLFLLVFFPLLSFGNVNTNDLVVRVRQLCPDKFRLAVEDLRKTFPDQYRPGDEWEKILAQFEAEKVELLKDLETGDKKAIHKAEKYVAELNKVLLANPLLKDKSLLLTRRFIGEKARQQMGGGLGITPNNFGNNSNIRKKGWKNDFVKLTDLAGKRELNVVYQPENELVIGNPDVHFSGEKLLYSSIGTNDCWHLFELDLKSGVTKQITPDWVRSFDCFDGCYAPDGNIIFCSTGTFLGLPCTNGGGRMCGLFLYDTKTGKIRQLTFDQDSNWEPVVMNNGQIMYQRWEYADLPHSNARLIFSMNPDGTTQQAVYGSNSYFPTSLFGARPIPGHRSAFVGVVTGHHSVAQSGRLMVFDPLVGNKEAEGVVAEIPHYGRKVLPVVRDRLPDGIWPQFLHPCPLNEKYFVVSMKATPSSLWGVYLVDIYNNITLIQESEEYAFLEPQLLESRTVPPVIPDRVDVSQKNATIYLQDVYFGGGLKGVEKGAVKKLRIGSYHFSPFRHGANMGIVGLDGPWDIKWILGTVDVEADGSAMFTVPANRPIFVQPLDKDGKALQLMRSWFTAMPGETLSCIGCHEDKKSVPIPASKIASKKKPQLVKPWYGEARGFSFRHEVQPVLDRACVACHNENNTSIPYLKGDRWITDWKSGISGSSNKNYGGGGHFTESYANLCRYVRRPGIESDMDMLVPMDVHADQTELMRMLNKGHHHVKLTAEEVERLACWIDFNTTFHGRREDIPTHEKSKEWNDLRAEFAPKFQVQDPDYSRLPELKTGIVAIMPEKQEVVVGETKLEGWPLYNPTKVPVNNARNAHNKQLALGNYQMEIPLSDRVSLDLIKIPAGEFLMGSTAQVDEMPRCKVQIAKAYWIGRFEVTNEMYALFDAEHNSRTEHRHGYQFGRRGYPMNKLDQPVVRISWKEAMAFCDWLSKKTGYTFTLPTEAQWEWACRAGSDTPFYFGALGSDFTNYANLGDIMLRDFAACTAFKNYESAKILDNPNKYDDWIPRDTLYNDRGFVSDGVGRYRPNPWDLHDMHGNVAEWTRSAYVPYPYQDTDGRNSADSKEMRVTRGGSWYDRPFRATSSFRQPYREYQKVFNVGFRVVMEE